MTATSYRGDSERRALLYTRTTQVLQSRYTLIEIVEFVNFAGTVYAAPRPLDSGIRQVVW
jgi:hypothetical protein